MIFDGHHINCGPGCGCETVRLAMSREGSDDWQDEYLTRLSPMFEKIMDSAVEEVAEWVRSLERVPTSEEFVAAVEDIVGREFERINHEEARRFAEDMYTFHYAADMLAPGAGISFGGADLRAIDAIAQADNLALSKFIKNRDAKATLTKFLEEEYLERGQGMFGREEPGIIGELKRALRGKLSEITNHALDRIVETSVQRIRNRGHLQQLDNAGVTYLQIFEPTRECDFCAAMHLQVIEVRAAADRVSFLNTLSDEEFIDQFKIDSNKPELGNMQHFIDEGMLPPFHPHCRGRIRKYRG